MTTFFLIRHGARDTPPDLLPGREAEIALTDRGRAQANRLVACFAGVHLHRVVSSPLERAVETATPLARDRDLTVELLPTLTEMDCGLWAGRRAGELADDEQWRRFSAFRSATRIPGGETALEVQRRFVSELLRLRDARPAECVACVGHADPIRFALVYFLGAPLDYFHRIEVSVGSVSELEISDWGARLVRLNEVPGNEVART